MALKFTFLCLYFGTTFQSTWQVLKCGAGEGWRRSVAPIMLEIKKCYLSQEAEEYPT